MKYIITENELNKLLDKFFIERYGDSLEKNVLSDGYIEFLDPEGLRPFEVNLAGTIWVNDYPFLKYLRKILSLNKEESEKILIDYFQDRYEIDGKRVNSEGGYSKVSDSENDLDPWLDNIEEKIETIIRGVINESKLDKKIFMFLNGYLVDHSPEHNNDLILYGRGTNNVIAYDKNEKLLMVADGLFQTIKNMFNLSNTATTRVFRDYFESMGHQVKRMH